VTPFKVQVSFDIPLFERQIDVDALEKSLNLLEGYYSIQFFFDNEKITFVLLKSFPHVKDWRECYWDRHKEDDYMPFKVGPTWVAFIDALKDKFYPIGSYDDQYTRWTTLCQERDDTMPEYIDIFHTLCLMLGIRDSEQNLVLKYHSGLHRYIQMEMDLLDISSIGIAYRYKVKIE
jgi:hypothetical protein